MRTSRPGWILDGRVRNNSALAVGEFNEVTIGMYLKRLHCPIAHPSYDRITLPESGRPWQVPDLLASLVPAIRKFEGLLAAPNRGAWWGEKPLQYPPRPIPRVPTGAAGPMT